MMFKNKCKIFQDNRDLFDSNKKLKKIRLSLSEKL